MNKVSRIFGSTVLATGLIFGGSATAAVAGGDDYKKSYKHDDNKRHSDNHKHANHKHAHGHGHAKHDHDRYWDSRYGHVYTHGHNHHDRDCDGKFHRVSYKDRDGHVKVIFVIVRLHH